MKKLVLLITAITTLNFCGVAQKGKEKTKLSKMDKEFLSKQADGIYAKFETSKGNIFLVLEHKRTPMTVANFVGLAEGSVKNTAKAEGVPFYDGLKFHRVIAGFMIQGGDPQGTGGGDPGYKFPDEFDDSLKHKTPGILSMANAGPGTNGSQFFITHVPTPHLDGKHSVFGHVISGQDVVDKIAQNDTIKKLTNLRKGKEAEAFNAPVVFETEKTNYTSKLAEKEKVAEEARKVAGAAALKAFADAKTTASGLKYLVQTEGTGATPTRTSNVTVHYTGKLTNGTIFDSSVQRGQPASFVLSQVIPGWTEGLQLMKEGSKYTFYIPYALGYGEGGYPGVIPPKSDLIFEVELIKVN